MNAPVEMPILSTKLLAAANGELRYQSEGGQIVNIAKDEKSQFVSSSGVYFLKMCIAKKYLTPTGEESTRLHTQDAEQTFGRRG